MSTLIRIITPSLNLKPATARLISRSIIIVSFLAFLLEIAPFITRDDTVHQALTSEGYKSAKERAANSFSLTGEPKIDFYEYRASKFVSVLLPIEVGFIEKNPLIEESTPILRIKYDIVILWLGLVLAAYAGIKTLFLESNDNLSDITTVNSKNRPDADLGNLSPVEQFEKEVQAARKSADEIFSRATFLVFVGVILAFVGVAIFYITLPETKSDESLNIYLAKVLRPTGVLIFVEAIAWFLLRQYRSLVEDYKWFYSLYLKRSNFLAAIRILDKESVRAEDIFIAASLVQEDYSGKLKSGETTESLEKLKFSEDGPVTELIKVFSNLKTNQAKNVAGKTNSDA